MALVQSNFSTAGSGPGNLEVGSHDHRKTIVSLTDPGRSAFTVREQTVIDRMVQAMSGCTAAERRQLAAAAPLLERLADLL